MAIGGLNSINTIQFSAGAPTYSFTFPVGGFQALTINGAGIVNNSSNAPIFGVGEIFFKNGSTAGNAIFSVVEFDDHSNAGTATISNTLGSGSTAEFTGSSSAANATITTNNGSQTSFGDHSTGGNANIITNSGGRTLFAGSSTAGNASILTRNGGRTDFFTPTTGQASFVTEAGGIVDFSGAFGANPISAGSIAGAGGYFLGRNALSVGSNGLSTTVGGVIADGGVGGGGGASLIKIGAGTLLLSGVNSYSGGTTVSAGTLQLAGVGTLGATTGNLAVLGGILDLNGTLQTTGAMTLNGGSIIGGTIASSSFGVQVGTISAVLAGSGALTMTGSGIVTLSGTNSYTGGTTISDGTLQLSGSGTLGSIARVTVVNSDSAILDLGGSTQIQNGGVTVAAGTIQNGTLSSSGGFDVRSGAVSAALTGSGALTKSTADTVTLSGVNTYGGGTFINAGVLSFSADSNLGVASGGLTFNGGTLRDTNFGSLVLSPTRAVTLNSLGGTFDVTNGGPFNVLAIPSAINGSGSLTKVGAGTLVLRGANSYGGTTNINVGALEVANGNAIPDMSAVTVASSAVLGIANDETIGSLAGAGKVLSPIGGGGVTLTTGADNTSTAFSGVISNGAALNLTMGLTKIGTGAMTLSGNNTYTGATAINGGTLIVDGSTVSSSLTTVNAGGTLGGNGIVGNTTINGGTLAPGNSIGTLTVQGSLVFTAASSYMVEVSPVSADRVNVNGTATLGGATVKASFAAGSYVSKQYTILSASGGVIGTFGSLASTNMPSILVASLGYDANNVYLNLDLAVSNLPGLNNNQQNVGNALTNFFNSNGSIPIVFGALTPAGLAQAAGETASGSQQTTFNAMTQFMGALLDPFIGGRGDAAAPAANATPFSDEAASAYASSGRKRSGVERDAYGVMTKAAPRNPVFDPRWSVWSAGFGGSQTTDGNAALGSNNTTSRVFGLAAGADYVFSPCTIAGFALAGGGTNFSVANGGSGRSDLFQAGAFVKHNAGNAYISGALAYGWQDITTDRTVTIAGVDRLRAEFNANALSGRVEGGYRFVAPWVGGVGITPYAAGQFTSFDLPAYAERVVSGANTFALAYSAKTVTASRSELGLRTDKSFAMPNAVLTLRGRLAWAHDFNADRNVAATFQALPGASFVVNGAAQAQDAALATASAEVKWLNGFSLAGVFEGEFSNVTRSYA
ncbi:MAG: autotransporter domain-containing protein, partial [Bradyrhizobium sp.]